MNSEHIGSPPCEIRSFESTAELVRTAARDWLELLQMLDMGGREPAVALSGGRVAVDFFDAACRLFNGHQALIRKVHFFWADERCVPPEHPDSNYRLAASHFLEPLDIPESNIHRIPGEFEPTLAATIAIRALAKLSGSDPGAVPVLDLVFLGMGEDGHVASLFPGEAVEAVDSAEVCRTVTAPKPPPRRVTVGYDVLQRAENVWVLVSGPGKEDALKQSLTAGDRTPLGRVLGGRSGTRIYTDLSPAGGFGA